MRPKIYGGGAENITLGPIVATGARDSVWYRWGYNDKPTTRTLGPVALDGIEHRSRRSPKIPNNQVTLLGSRWCTLYGTVSRGCEETYIGKRLRSNASDTS